jgi:hypothetical protein
MVTAVCCAGALTRRGPWRPLARPWYVERSASAFTALSRLAHEWRDERPSDGRHPTYDRSDCRSSKVAAEISPSDAVARRALTWRGMAAKTVKAAESCRIEVRFLLSPLATSTTESPAFSRTSASRRRGQPGGRPSPSPRASSVGSGASQGCNPSNFLPRSSGSSQRVYSDL